LKLLSVDETVLTLSLAIKTILFDFTENAYILSAAA
jgi:hypothetical protein